MSLTTKFSKSEIKNLSKPEIMKNASYDDILDSSLGVNYNVIVLCRESTKHEEQIKALQDQKDRMLKFVAGFPHLHIIEGGVIVEEGKSGLLPIDKRPAFQEMMKMALGQDVDLIIVQELSRFSRNLYEFYPNICTLEANDVGLLVPEGEFFTYHASSYEKIRIANEISKAEAEAYTTSKRVAKAWETIKENGQLAGGDMFGYKLVTAINRRDNTLVADPVEAEIVKMIFHMYVVDGVGSGEIATILNIEGYKPFNKETEWDATKVIRVLKNEKYMGYQMYGKYETTDTRSKTKKATHKEPIRNNVYDKNGKIIKQCNLVRGNWKPIIDEDLWWEAYEIRKQRSNSMIESGINVNSRGIRMSCDAYANKSFCQCGYTMSPQLEHKATDTKDAQYRYKCRHQINTHTKEYRKKRGLKEPEHICEVPAVSDVKMKLMSIKVFEAVFDDVDSVINNTIKVLLEAESRIDSSIYEGSVEEFEERLKKLNKRLDSFFDMRADGEMNDEQYFKKKQSTEDEIESISKLILKKKQEEAERNKFKLDINAIRQRLDLYVDTKGFGISQEMIDMFVERIICREDNEFLWEMNLTGTIPMNYHIREYSQKHEESLKDDKNFNIIKTITITLDECKEFCERKAKRQFRQKYWSQMLVKIAVK